jgi:hypothetical protein
MPLGLTWADVGAAGQSGYFSGRRALDAVNEAVGSRHQSGGGGAMTKSDFWPPPRESVRSGGGLLRHARTDDCDRSDGRVDLNRPAEARRGRIETHGDAQAAATEAVMTARAR